MPVFIISAGLAGVVAHPIILFLALVLHGRALSLTNVAMNVEADRFDYATDQRILNCHGIWGVGLLATALFGAAMRGSGVAPTVHLGLLVPVLIGLLLLAVLPMPESIARPI